MARAQQGGTITGGGIDPYVAQASMQRSAARNRMKETMVKEAGATRRQGMQGDAQVAQANIQAAAAKSMQDANAAERELARRQDNEFNTEQKKVDNDYWMEKENRMGERKAAEKAEDWKQLGQLSRDERMARAEQDAKWLAFRRDQTNLLLNMAKEMKKEKTGEQKGATANYQIDQETQERIDFHEQARASFFSKMNENDTYIYDPDYAGAPSDIDLDRRIPTGARLMSKLPFTGKLKKLMEKERGREKKRIEDIHGDTNSAKMERAFFTSIHDDLPNLSELTPGSFTREGISSISLQMHNGAIEAKDIGRLDASLKAMEDYNQRESLDGSDEKMAFHTKEFHKWEGIRSDLEFIQHSKKGHELMMPGGDESIAQAMKRELTLTHETDADRAQRTRERQAKRQGGLESFLEEAAGNIPGEYRDSDLSPSFRVGGLLGEDFASWKAGRRVSEEGKDKATLGDGRIELQEWIK